MVEDKKLTQYIQIFREAENPAEWISAFREKYYTKKKSPLPILLLYQAQGIARQKSSRLYKNKGAAIAITTSKLQQDGFLLPKSNSLSMSGDLKEIALLKKLGKAKTELMIDRFENL